MNDIPRSTVIALLIITVLVSVLGTMAVIMNTKPAFLGKPDSTSSASMYESSLPQGERLTSGKVSMCIRNPSLPTEQPCGVA